MRHLSFPISLVLLVALNAGGDGGYWVQAAEESSSHTANSAAAVLNIVELADRLGLYSYLQAAVETNLTDTLRNTRKNFGLINCVAMLEKKTAKKYHDYVCKHCIECSVLLLLLYAVR